jgi:hypothetical protein
MRRPWLTKAVAPWDKNVLYIRTFIELNET